MTEVIPSAESERVLRINRYSDDLLRLFIGSDNDGAIGIHVKTEDLVSALVRLGVVKPDDGLRKRLEGLIADVRWDQDSVSIKRLDEALNPTPPFEFPKAHAAVIDAYKEDGTGERYTLVGKTWRNRLGNGMATSTLRMNYKEFRVVHEGMVEQ